MAIAARNARRSITPSKFELVVNLKTAKALGLRRTLKWLKVKVPAYRVEERGFYKP